MEPLKSRAQALYLGLCQQQIRSGPPCPGRSANTRRDVETLLARFSNEGLSFLTKTLPRLGKWFDSVLVGNKSSKPPGFATRKSSSIPAFLQAYFQLVLTDDLDVREDAPPAVVLHIRQVCFVLYKLELPYTREQETRVIESFQANERVLNSLDLSCAEELLALCSRITETVFDGFDPKNITPRHGPGSVATGERDDTKWSFSRKYRSIHSVYPYYDYFMVGKSSELLDRLDWYKSLRVLERGIAKVVLVPKDSRGPRLISCEPLEYQWIQQGLGRKLSNFLESTSKLTRGHINFTDQEVNRNHALESSRTRKYATIDLKDASDLVSCALVSKVFSREPYLLKHLMASRTEATLLPSGDVLDLQKYAPMGSALCFPVEAYVFWVVCTASVVSQLGLPLKKAAAEIYVYGDDIVIPTEWVSVCCAALESVGLAVNYSKCCIQGYFRESCGMDAFNGVQVTPTRLKSLWTGRSTDGRAYVSYLAFLNHMRGKGYEAVADYIQGELESVYGVLPRGTSLSPFPCVIVPSAAEAEEFNALHFRRRWNRHYQRFEYFVLRTASRKADTKLDSWVRLLRNQVIPNQTEPSVIVFPRSMYIKRGWSGVF